MTSFKPNQKSVKELSSKTCECCRKSGLNQQHHDPLDLDLVLICRDCKKNLDFHSLSPREWYNLVVIHGESNKSLIDFYYWDGEAKVPTIIRNFSESEKLPSLESINGNLTELVEYCLFPFKNKSNIAQSYQALSAFTPNEIIIQLDNFMDNKPTTNVYSYCYKIYKNVIKGANKQWIEKQWKLNSITAFFNKSLDTLLEASITCLTSEQILENARPLFLIHHEATAILLQHSEFTEVALMWLEKNITQPYSLWGKKILNLKITWNILEKWLSSNRALGLVAIEALTRLKQILNPPTYQHMTHILAQYELSNPTPKIKQSITYIKKKWQDPSHQYEQSKISEPESLYIGLRRIERIKNIQSYYINTMIPHQGNNHSLQTKLGGQPYWLDQPEWPISKSNGKPLLFFGQIVIEKLIFPNIAAKVAYLFLDEGWENGAVILQPGKNDYLTTLPNQEGPLVDINTYLLDTRLVSEPDYVPRELTHKLSLKNYNDFYQNPLNKIGGIPIFLQDDEYPEDEKEWNLLLQFTSLNSAVDQIYFFISASGKFARVISQST